jgi:hypothetical protein
LAEGNRFVGFWITKLGDGNRGGDGHDRCGNQDPSQDGPFSILTEK